MCVLFVKGDFGWSRTSVLHAARATGSISIATYTNQQWSAARRQECSKRGQIRKIRATQGTLQNVPRECAKSGLRKSTQNTSQLVRLVHERTHVQF